MENWNHPIEYNNGYWNREVVSFNDGRFGLVNPDTDNEVTGHCTKEELINYLLHNDYREGWI